MKILFISAVLPYPLKSGGHIRVYQLLKRLSKHHEITLFAYYRTEDELVGLDEVKKYCKEVRVFYRGRVWNPRYWLTSIFNWYPVLVNSYNLPEIHDAVADKLKHNHYDVIHAEPFYVASVVPKEYWSKLVVCDHNIEYRVYQDFSDRYRFIPFLYQLMSYDIWKMRRIEETVWKQAKKIIAVSEHDHQIIESRAYRGDVAVVSNGVDIDYYAFEERKKSDEPQFLFVGNFSWPPNIHIAQKLFTSVWPKIKNQYPNAHLTVVGAHMPSVLKQLANIHGIETKAWVEDLRELYRKSSALLAPIAVAGGTKFKILEAMACGLPVITTTEGIQGLPLVDKKHVLIVQDDTSYVEAISFILHEPRQIAEMVKRARKLIETQFSWDMIANALSEVWKKI